MGKNINNIINIFSPFLKICVAVVLVVELNYVVVEIAVRQSYLQVEKQKTGE